MVTAAANYDSVSTSIVKRRARNRASQKTFRERQARYVKELEEAVAANGAAQPDSVELDESRAESARLRTALKSSRQRVLALRDALNSVADEIQQALASGDLLTASSVPSLDLLTHKSLPPSPDADNDAEGSELPERPPDEPAFAQGETVNAAEDAPHTLAAPGSNDPSAVRHDLENEGMFDLHHPMDESPILHRSGIAAGDMVSSQWINGRHALPATQEPILFPGDTPDGSLDFAGAGVSFPPGVINFPSVFSAHLAIIELFIKKNPAYEQRLLPQGHTAYSKLISTAVTMFIDTCWPEMRLWMAYIRSYAVIEKLIRWSLDSCLENYKALPVTHRPTALQLCTSHPQIIDWAFFPTIRDRLIELYSNSWILDEIVCELVHSYVVEAELTHLVAGLEGVPLQQGYFRVWDIIQAISSDQTSQAISWNDDDLFTDSTSPLALDNFARNDAWTKMPLEEIYKSREAAWKLFKLLRMEDRRAVKLDPAFAAAHPELCDEPGIIASGIDCTLRSDSSSVPRAKPLTREAIINYKMMLWRTTM